MKTDDKIRDKKLEYDINREAAKISALSSGEEILSSHQTRIIEQAKFTYSPLGKAFEKQIKNNWRPWNKTSWRFKSFKTNKKINQVNQQSQQDIKSIEGTLPKEMRTNEIRNEIDEIKTKEKKRLKKWAKKYIYDFLHYETMKYFPDI